MGIERIHELLDELGKATKELFPECTRISATVGIDGYTDFTVLKWGKGEEAETTLRRELFEQTKVGNVWGEDRSHYQNEYYEKLGLLLDD